MRFRTRDRRLKGGGVGPYGRGRVFRMEFAPDNPKKVVDLSIVLDGNAPTNPVAPPSGTRTTWGSVRTA